MTDKKKSNTGGVAQLLKISPMADLMSPTAPKLPDVKAPSLENLAIEVPQLPDLTENDVLERFGDKARALAKTRDRAMGESLKMGDEIQINTIGYSEGRLIPFSARFDQWMPLEPMQMLTGFSETIAQATVGASIQIDLVFPADYPTEWLRKKPGRFMVDVLAAREVTLPDMESPAFLKKAKLGDNLEDAMVKIREELEEEMVDALWVTAREMVLDELADRADVKVPPKLVDEEIRRRWGSIEGQSMVEKEFDVAEQQEALDAWLKDPMTRMDCEQRLRINLALRAMTESEKLELGEEKLQSLLVQQVKSFGMTAADVKAALKETPETAKYLIEMGWYFLAVEHALSKAKITFEGAASA